MPNHGLRTMLLTIGFLVGLVLVFQAIGFSESTRGGHEPAHSLTAAGAWTIFTFEDVEDARAIGRQQQASFGEAWCGMVEERAEGRDTGPAGSSSNTVATLWFPPTNIEEGGVSFNTPVNAIAFDYWINSELVGPTALFFDSSGTVIARLGLNAIESTSSQVSHSGEQAGGARDMQSALFVAPPGLRIARMDFEGARAVVGHFTLDNFAVLDLDLIFADGFEIGSTGNWDLTVSPTMTPTPHPPTCDDLIVGEIDWDNVDGIVIEPVINAHPTALLVHKRTDLDWTYFFPMDPTLRWAYFEKSGGSVIPYGARRPPIGRAIDIPFQPGESAPFRADWHVNDDGFYPGVIEIRFRFEYTGGGPTCEYVRTIEGEYTPTNTPTTTPTLTPTPDFG